MIFSHPEMLDENIWSLAFLIVSFGLFTCAELGLPMIQISHDDIGDDYPEMQEKVRLEDFFWTGSGDGPPEYIKKVHTGISKGKEMIVKTETVVATVYVDGKNEVDIPICLDCFPDDGGAGGGIDFGGSAKGADSGSGIAPLNYSSTDRRYWLLTVMSGFYTAKNNPFLEEKLARLYRVAFTRQHSRHLGIGNGALQNFDNVMQLSEENRTESGLLSEEDENTSKNENEESIRRKRTSEEEISKPIDVEEDTFSSTLPSYDTKIPIGVTASYESILSGEVNVTNSIFHLKYSPAVGVIQPHQSSSAAMFNNRATSGIVDEIVQVVIHNVTQFTEDDIQSGTMTTASDEDINAKIDERPIANQTEIIYSVFVDGRPVLAVTAANDMKLVSEGEVVNVLGTEIFLKAEPYLREPQATPLAPAIERNGGNVGLFASMQENPFLYIVTSVAILLLLIIFIVLLLLVGFKRHNHCADVKRASSRNVLLNESNSPNIAATAIETGRATVGSRDIGVQNFSFETDNARSRSSHVNFAARSSPATRSNSFTSSDNTSDSSVYCPINPPKTDVQRMLDDKAATLFDKRHSRHFYDRAEGHEAVYSSVVADKKRKNLQKLNKVQKSKKRYISENRVGSIADDISVHHQTQQQHQHQQHRQHSSSEGGTDSNESLVDALHPNYENCERNETYNRQNNYHRNKLLQNRIFTGQGVVDEVTHSAESINRKIIRALQPSEKSSETGSIGSFLSMASVKSFPKSSHPEPLNRVLDPVFVTYYDNVEDSVTPTQQVQPPAKMARKNPPRNSNSASAALAKLPAPKAPLKSIRIASQSDNPDPGVIGPIVWEIHKKKMTSNDNANTFDFNSVRDPATARNHYEGLLEGAIQMYSSQDDLAMPLPTKDFTNNRKPTKRENRGKSAEIFSSSEMMQRNKFADGHRPMTAQPEKLMNTDQLTRPPSPSSGAWGGSASGSYSPLCRPLSAGPIIASTTTKSNELLAAPLIEAIQNELKKFKHHEYCEKK